MGSTRSRSFAAASLITAALLARGPLAAQDRATKDAAPTFRAGVDLVLVDMRVMRGDQQVSDLTPADLTLLVDGRSRPIVSLDYAGASGPAEGAQAAAIGQAAATSPKPPRRLVLVIDRDSLDNADAQKVLESARSFIEKAPPDYAFAVVTLPLGASIRFETDRALVDGDLAHAFAGSERRGPGLEGIAGFGCTGEAASFGCGVRGLPYKIEHQLARSMITGSEWQFRGQNVLRDLQYLFRTISGGPSDVVLLTGGLPRDERLRPEVDRTLEIARRSRVRVHAVTADDVSRVVLTPGGAPEIATLDDVRGQQHKTYDLPAETGGIEQEGAGGAAGFFTRLSRELAGSYLLSFEPLPSERDDRPHEIEVRVSRTPRPTVHARKTFILGPPPPEGAEAPATALAAHAPAEPAAFVPVKAAEPSRDTASPADGQGLRGMLRRASGYVDAFERSLSGVLAEERYVQVIRPWRGEPPHPGAEASLAWSDAATGPGTRHGDLQRRQLVSDLLMVQPPGRKWMGVRDVAEVDGRRIRDRDARVGKLFLSGTPDARRKLLRIASDSARHNLGASRNINVPSLPLQILRPGNLARFEWRTGDQRRTLSDPPGCTVVAFRETAEPSIVRTPSGRSVPMTGQFCIEPATGRVWRATIRFSDRAEHVEGAFEVTFRPESDLDVLVPDRAWEWSLDGSRASGDGAAFLEGLASYSNLRRLAATPRQAAR